MIYVFLVVLVAFVLFCLKALFLFVCFCFSEERKRGLPEKKQAWFCLA